MSPVEQAKLFAPSGQSFASHEEWFSWLQDRLGRPDLPPNAPMVLDLFAGCGGMALGFEAAGFKTIGYEMKPDAVNTYNANLAGSCNEQKLSLGMPDAMPVDVVIGGPPCQPFSQIGYQQGRRDPRDGFPIFLDAVRRIDPKIAIIENVRGLLYKNREYVGQTIRELESFGYKVFVELINSADFGVPQKRERVVIVATKVGWEWPEPSVSHPVSAGIALGPSSVAAYADSKFLSKKVDKYIATYEAKSQCATPRDLHLDRPARTVTCRNLHARTADMLRIKLPDGRRRMLHVKEAALLQSFPPWFAFKGNTVEQYEQIGNAVPPLVALALAQQVRRFVENPAMTKVAKKASSKLVERALSIPASEQRIEEALQILQDLGVRLKGLPPMRQKRLGMALLAAANMTLETEWREAKSVSKDAKAIPLTTKQFYLYWNEHFGTKYALGGYDDVKRLEVDPLLRYRVVELKLVPTKSGRPGGGKTYNASSRGYSLTEEARDLLRSFGKRTYGAQLSNFRQSLGLASDRLSRHHEIGTVPITLPDGSKLLLSQTHHNEIQRAVISRFLPRFAPGSEVLYIANTGVQKSRSTSSRTIEPTNVVFREDDLKRLRILLDQKKKLPDVILYDRKRNWVFLIEAVHSKNPISEIRHLALAEATSKCTAGRIYVTAFLDRAGFAKFSREIDWKTEAWIADEPEHLVHFDGERFLGPYESQPTRSKAKKKKI